MAELQKLAENRRLRLLLKVAGVPSLCPAGIGELMAGGELKPLNPGGWVEDALRTTRIGRLLNACVDEISALRSFSETPRPPLRAAAGCEAPSGMCTPPGGSRSSA